MPKPDNSPTTVNKRRLLAKAKQGKINPPAFKKPLAHGPLKIPVWDGPDSTTPNGGITFSLLSKFIVCRHRFYLRVVKGLREEHVFSHHIEYGNYIHEAEEAYHKWCQEHYVEDSVCGTRTPSNDYDDAGAVAAYQRAMTAHRRRLLQEYPNDVSEIDKWYNLSKRQYPVYLKYWAKHWDEKQRQPLLQEAVFKVPYKLPSGRTVILRGKFDSVHLMPISSPKKPGSRSNPKLGIFVQENKTKGKIDEEGLLATVAQNLQTMLYLVVLDWLRTNISLGAEPYMYLPGVEDPSRITSVFADNTPIGGVLYNVIRRPLSDAHAIKQRKGREVKGKRVGMETIGQFYDRVITDPKNGIGVRPQDYFYRWKVDLGTQDIDNFRSRILDPWLENLCDWWQWIRANPSDPWTPRRITEISPDLRDAAKSGTPFQQHLQTQVVDAFDTEPIWNSYHLQTPFGVYNGLFDGMRGDYFDLLSSDREYGLEHTPNLFPEL